MHRSLLKTASILALTFISLPAFAQSYSAASVDPYGYGSVPLPPPQPMIMPSFRAQQTGYAPLSQYAPQYATANNAALYAGQSTPQPVAVPQLATVPNYLPETNRAQNYVRQSPQASSVGYVVQPQATGGQPQPIAPQQVQYATAPAPTGYAYATQQTATYAPTPVVQAPTPYANGQYAVDAQAPTVSQYAPAQYGSSQYGSVTAVPPSVQVQTPVVQAPSVQMQAPSIQATAPSYSSGYASATMQTPSSIATAPSYDGSYQVASAAPSYTAPSYGASTPSYTDPSQGQPVQAGQVLGGQPQVQTYAYNGQPQTYTTTQIYTPSPALTVQQQADVAPAPTASASVSSDNVSLATDPSVGPWYFSLRSGLTIPQDTSFNRAGKTWENEFQPGWQLGTGVGYEFKSFNNWLAPRAEAELVYDQQLIDSNSVAGVKTTDPDAYGFVRNLDLFANGFLDFRLNRYLSPYIGGGIGLGYADFDRVGNSATGVVMDDNDVGFVWQAMGGLGINLSSATTLDVGYRYVQNTGVTLKARDGTQTTTDEGKHVFMIGFRNNF